jgi:hypothetical protein
MRLTVRDLEILLAVKRHRLLRSTHIVALVPGSRQATLRRLQLLFHHGYLDRPPAQLNWYLRGSEPLVYALGNRGARLPEVGGGLLRWDTKNGRLSRMYLSHALAVAEVMVGFEVACRKLPGARLISAEEILELAPKARRPKRLPIRWSVEAKVEGRFVRLGIEPDKVFGIRFGEGPGAREVFFFLEVDRGTMPVIRKGLGQTSIRRKLLAYEATWRQGWHQALLGIPDFRVLVVASSAARVSGILAASGALSSGGAKRILVASVAEALRDAWTDGRGRPEAFLRPPVSRGHSSPREEPRACPSNPIGGPSGLRTG